MNIVNAIKNPCRYVYKVGQRGKFLLPTALAKFLSAGDWKRNAVVLLTPDGSGQACHPSVAQFRGRTYMACTPYPYGMEFYENPCLYVRSDPACGWEPVPSVFPLVRAEYLGKEHYSDPCLFVREERLFLLYRKCERRANGKIDQVYLSSSLNGDNWDPPVRIAELAGDMLISPAVGAGTEEFFCVEIDGTAMSRIVRYDFSDTRLLGVKQECEIRGLADDWYVWHIDIREDPDGGLKGLFLLRKARAPRSGHLALFRFNPKDLIWHLERDLLPPGKERSGSTIYKSCFAESPDRLLCSAYDEKFRFYLYEQELDAPSTEPD